MRTNPLMKRQQLKVSPDRSHICWDGVPVRGGFGDYRVTTTKVVTCATLEPHEVSAVSVAVLGCSPMGRWPMGCWPMGGCGLRV
jgi:hypothetical protein